MKEELLSVEAHLWGASNGLIVEITRKPQEEIKPDIYKALEDLDRKVKRCISAAGKIQQLLIAHKLEEVLKIIPADASKEIEEVINEAIKELRNGTRL